MRSAGRSASGLGVGPAILVIGYGNPLRGDDGAGFFLAEQLVEAVNSPSVSVLACHQLTPELAEPVSHCQFVVFLDASCDDVPGRTTEREILPETTAAATSSHVLSPGTLLGCAQLLYGHAPEAILFTVGGERFDYHEGLSAIVDRACVELVPRIGRLVREKGSVASLRSEVQPVPS